MTSIKNVYHHADEWRNEDGLLHREDGPAIKWSYGTNEWWQNGKRHREGGPAIEGSNGSCQWWQWGHLHRAVGPATIQSDGLKEWWQNGKRISLHVEDILPRYQAAPTLIYVPIR